MEIHGSGEEGLEPAGLRITPEKNRECALLAAIAFLLGFLLFGGRVTLMLSFHFALVGILVPALMTPVSCVWFRLYATLGSVVFRGVGTVACFCIIAPAGFIIWFPGRWKRLPERWEKMGRMCRLSSDIGLR